MVHPGPKWYKQVSPDEETEQETRDRLEKAGIISRKKAKTDETESGWGHGSYQDWEKCEKEADRSTRNDRNSATSSWEEPNTEASYSIWGDHKRESKGNKGGYARNAQGARQPSSEPTRRQKEQYRRDDARKGWEERTNKWWDAPPRRR